MSAAVQHGQTNGYGPAAGLEDAQERFYDQMLKLREEVLADRHHLFKLPAAVREQLRSQAPAPAARAPPASGVINGTNAEISQSTNQTAFQSNVAQTTLPAPAADTTRSVSYSGIDPVLLTKSDDLVRAEAQLKRQRIERELKDAFDQRKHSSRDRDSGGEPTSLIALSDILQKALEIVKPISGLEPAPIERVSPGSSFDENSYYSSQANDWSSGSPNSRQSEAAAVDAAEPTVQVSQRGGEAPASDIVSFPTQQTSGLNSLDLQAHAAKPPMTQEELYKYYEDASYASDGVVDGEESDYSPPAADAFTGTDADIDGEGEAMDLDDGMHSIELILPLRSNSLVDSIEYTPQILQPAEPPSPQVIKNHLTQIAAPQPSRVSPLAVTKVPALSQPEYHNGGQNPQFSSSRVQAQTMTRTASEASMPSPRYSGQEAGNSGSKRRSRRPLNKKRKREGEAPTSAKKGRERPAALSPEPYIKDEPVSPPPFATIADVPGVMRRPTYAPNPDVEVVSPRDHIRARQGQTYEQPLAQVPRYAYEPSSRPAMIRVDSPSSPRARPRRDDRDLRRVASLHAAQRPYSPVTYSPVAPYRAASQNFSDHPGRHVPVYSGEEVVRVPEGHYARPGRVSPPHLREVTDQYVQRVYSPAPMAPPPPPPTRRIVMDQYGNKYYAAEPEPIQRASVAPPARQEILYERAPSRMSTACVPRGPQSVHGDDGRIDMPPPPPVHRMTVQPESEAPVYRTYQREISMRPPEPQYFREEPTQIYYRESAAPSQRHASVQAYEPAQPAYIQRAYSVRPENGHVPETRYLSRQPTVAPVEYVRRQPEAATLEPAVRAVSRAASGRYGQALYEYAEPAPPERPQSVVRYAREEDIQGSKTLDPYGRELRRY
ncbi:hypothetical protein M8818_001393 [Zalaria obscura]|uniref:Uncharacterized protein n=1 Tax=Zalaria obscura TaxID=2024903 RepID=A0ACC3SK32_9PEZI